MSQTQKQVSKLSEKIENARTREEKTRRDREKDILSKFKEAEKKRNHTKKIKMDEEVALHKLIYERDQRKYFDQRNLSVVRRKQDDEEVEAKLRKFEQSMEIRAKNKEENLDDIKKKAKNHMDQVMTKLDSVKNKSPEEEMDYNELAKTFKKKLEASKNRHNHLKHMVSKKSQALKIQQDHARNLIQSETRQTHERQKKILQRLRQKDAMLKEKAKMNDERIQEIREIQRLKRENQMFNLKREQLLSQDYKRKLINKIEEKNQKVSSIKKERSNTAAITTSAFLNMTVL